VALAAAVNYPAPFVTGGNADAALVWGIGAANSDLAAVMDITSNLNSYTVASTVTTDTTVSGEAYELFTSSTPLLLGNNLNTVRQTLSESHLPTVLADGTFETTTNVEYTQRISLGATPTLEFKQQPTSSDDPQLGFSLSTTPSTGYAYNASIIFDENVNFTHADAIGESIEFFGQQFTVGGATTATKLILLKSSQTVSLSSDADISTTVTVGGETFTVELVSASDNDARIKVTDSSGASDTKTISEDNSKTIRGLEVGVVFANEDTARNIVQADLTIGASRITLQDGVAVKYGTDDTTIEGTLVKFYLTNSTTSAPGGGLGKIDVQVTADDSDEDAITSGEEFVDPVFGSFKIDFSGTTAEVDGADRETIEIANSGNDKMIVKFQSHDGDEIVSANWVYNKTDSQSSLGADLADNDGNRIHVAEMELVNKSEYVVLSNTDEGGLYEVTSIVNSSDGFSDDYVDLKNVFTGKTTQYKATSEGTISGVTEQGKTFTITYTGPSTAAQETRQIRVNYDESTSNNMILFPTIATSKGAKVGFYEPTSITLTAWDGSNTATGVMFDDGDGYQTVQIGAVGVEGAGGGFNVTYGGSTTSICYTGPCGVAALNASSATVDTGALNLTFTATAANTTRVNLIDPQGSSIARPALFIYEEKDEASAYEAMVVTLDAGYDGDSAGIGVTEVMRTWGGDATNDEVQLESDSDLYEEMDLWGSIIQLDKSDSDQTTATISYPDDQLHALVYMAEVDAVITPGAGGGSGGTSNLVSVSDAEVNSVAGKNLIVVGGSCVNTVAADLLSLSPSTCGDAFTAATTVGSGQFLIETFSRGDTAIATLVAGYNAQDTTNAATYLTTQTVDTTVGKKYVGTSSTSAELVTDSTTTDDSADAAE
jgi:hypothetical protein